MSADDQRAYVRNWIARGLQNCTDRGAIARLTLEVWPRHVLFERRNRHEDMA